MSEDRTVHASDDTREVVRYDRAGKWFCESKTGDPPVPLTIAQAVQVADLLWRTGGSPHFGRRGGAAFDRKLRALYAKAAQ